MDRISIRPYRHRDEEAVIRLWEECGLVVPWNDPGKDIRRKMTVGPGMFLVGVSEDRVVATVMAGYEGHRGWINYLAVHPDLMRRGIGSLLMERAEHLLKEAGCPKVNLQVRSSNRQVIEFYRSIGYKVDDVVSMGKRLDADE
ncbi:MAG: GNAT family acetyltransferase [Candidatus Fermentibacteraceae bacterium]|nr:GNAT family acetyltransferase [Candidatus Fermentibacteraceae bacterium]